jgi:CRISPR-associated endonuclease Csn1
MPPKQCPAGCEFVMRLIVNDSVELISDRTKKLCRIVKMSQDKICLAPLNEGGSLKARDADKEDPFKYVTKSPNALRPFNFRLVHIDECGFVLRGNRS